MATQIHSTSIISPSASIGSNVEIGPYSVVESNVVIGDECSIGNHVTLCDGTHLGKGCRVFHGAVLGEIPQYLEFEGEETTLEFGDKVTVRECVTVHRGTRATGKTEIGSHCYLMAYAHVGHDCFIGENVILSNSVQLGGHVSVDDWANIGGVVAVHQFCKVGKHAFIAGGYRVVQDVPPYTLAAGEPLKYSGLNSVGLRRRGCSPETRKNIKQAYHLIYRSSMNTTQAVEEIKRTLPQGEEIKEIISFVENSERGLI